MAKFDSIVNFLFNPVKSFVLERNITNTINAALTAQAQLGYDTTALRALIFDGTTIRQLLQSNDIDTSTTLAGASASDLKVASQKAVKAYIDSNLAAGLNPYSDFDASVQTTLPAGATLKDRYRVTAAGTVQTIVLQVGDVLSPRVASPSSTVATDWVVIQGNADKATNSVLGLMLIATLAEVQANAAGNADKALTVSVFNSFETANVRVKKFTVTQNIPVGATGITHNLNSTAIQVTFYDANGPVFYDWTVTNANAIAVNANTAISTVTTVIQA